MVTRGKGEKLVNVDQNPATQSRGKMKMESKMKPSRSRSPRSRSPTPQVAKKDQKIECQGQGDQVGSKRKHHDGRDEGSPIEGTMKRLSNNLFMFNF